MKEEILKILESLKDFQLNIASEGAREFLAEKISSHLNKASN